MAIDNVASASPDTYYPEINTTVPKIKPKQTITLANGLLGLAALGSIGAASVALRKHTNVSKELKSALKKLENAEKNAKNLETKVQDVTTRNKELESAAKEQAKKTNKVEVKTKIKTINKPGKEIVVKVEDKTKINELEERINTLETEKQNEIAEKNKLARLLEKIKDSLGYKSRKKIKPSKNSLEGKKPHNIERKHRPIEEREARLNKRIADLSAKETEYKDKIAEMEKEAENLRTELTNTVDCACNYDEALTSANEELNRIKGETAILRHNTEMHQKKHDEISDAFDNQTFSNKAKTWAKVKIADIKRFFSRKG